MYVFLGEDPVTGWDHNSKSVVGHEFGHYVQDRLFGSPAAGRMDPYAHSSVTTGCHCAHVAAGNSHCLQSREFYEAAFGEGWGHFYASRMYNVSSQSSAAFGYYKNAYADDASSPVVAGTALSTPISVPLLNSVRWSQNHCFAADMATERDFLGFFYSSNTQSSDAIPIQSLANVFKNGCVGTACTFSDSISWNDIFNSAAILPASQRDWIRDRGDVYGVDN